MKRLFSTMSIILVLMLSANATVLAQQTQKKAANQKQATTSKSTQSKRPLATNEDPEKIGQRNINKGPISWMSMSISREVALGRQIAAEVDRQAKFVDDPIITEYVNRVGQNIVNHSDARVPFTIKVIDSDEMNAFALPGGFFYVNRGLILAADNEAELAGVMAHEIAHVAARHAVEMLAKANLAQYGMIAGILLGIPPILVDAASIGLGIGFLKFSRGAETEADRLGVQYLYAAGYDPTAMATVFEKLAAKNQKKPGAVSKLFSTHPYAQDRREVSLALAARFPEREEYVISSSEFQGVKGRLMRMTNARATTAGNIPGSTEDGAPGRPTLKRRGESPDDGMTSDSDAGQAADDKPAPPKLKRNDPPPPPQSDENP